MMTCKVYGVPQEWSIYCWLFDTLSSAITFSITSEGDNQQRDDKLEFLSLLNNALLKMFVSMIGPNVLR